MTKILALLAFMIALLAASFFIWRSTLPDPFELPGKTWIRDFMLAGDKIRLLDSGQYVSYHWCDICEIDYRYGAWSRSGDTFTLRPDTPDRPVRKLVQQTVGTCQYLVPLNGKPAPDFGQAFQPEGQDCGHGR